MTSDEAMRLVFIICLCLSLSSTKTTSLASSDFSGGLEENFTTSPFSATRESAFVTAEGRVGDNHARHILRLQPCLGCAYSYSFSTSCTAIRLGTKRHDSQAAAHATVLVKILALHHVAEDDYHICRLMMSGMVASAGNHETLSSDRATLPGEWEAALGKEAFFHWHADGRISKVMSAYAVPNFIPHQFSSCQTECHSSE
jgi:hypothetical protein